MKMPEYGNIIGFVESIGDGGVAGWGFRAGDENPLRLSLVIDGAVHSSFLCNLRRDDVVNARNDVISVCRHGAQLGFAVNIPKSCFDGAEHELKLLTEAGEPARLITIGAGPQNSWRFSIPRVRVLGQVDTAKDVARVHGWAIVLDQRTGEKRGRNRIRIFTARSTLGEIEASAARPDVARALGVEPHCGFVFHPAIQLSREQPTEVHFAVLPEGIELQNSPVVMGGRPTGTWCPPTGDREGEEGADCGADGKDVAAPIFPDISNDPRISFTRFPVSTLFGIGDTLAKLRRMLTTADPTDGGLERYEADPEHLVATEFDREYYLATNPDVAAASIDPIIHYVRDGWREQRRPTAWFDTTYYLKANPDVRDAGVNPFWHFLAGGRAEGRLPAPAGGHRREIIANLVEPHKKAQGYFRPSSFSKLLGTHLEKKVSAAMARGGGFVLSVSHDCYIRSIGGVQIFIADEQAAFARRGFGYLNISPLYADLVLADSAGPRLLQLVLDGTYLGITTHDELAEILGRFGPRPGEQRIFVVHSVLGHQPELLVSLQGAIRTSQNYFWVHDFFSMCESINLLRNDITFCGAPGPGSVSCRVCIYGTRRSAHLARIRDLFEQIPFTVVAPSRSALAIWQKGSSLPHVDALVHEHCYLEEDAVRVSLVDEGERGSSANPVRVAFAGHTASHKGWPVFSELVRRSRHLSCYRFYHFSSAEVAPTPRGVTRVVARTSPTDRDAMIDALATHAIDLVVVPAPWPETFSYITYEALAAGADIVSSAESGNVADVVLGRKRGIVFQGDDALFDLFESLRAVEYVRQCYQQGVNAGRLIHCGTTATLNAVSLAAAAE